VTAVPPTAEFASLVYGDEGVGLDDAAETFHEASRLYPNVAPARLATLLGLGREPELRHTLERASRTHAHRSGVALPHVRLPRVPLRDAFARRVSQPAAPGARLELPTLAALLGAAYGARRRADGPLRRPVPSGGALYPLELYVLPRAVGALAPSAFHYDPFAHRLEELAPLGDLPSVLVDPTIAERATCLLAVTGMFWRSRIKYGQRGYRFALLEAGHVVQNVLLAAAALELPALPLGGFYDRRADALVGADGLDESTLYLVALGGDRK
jgi:SagB-type dehydrogenase family enzyme